MFGIITKKQIRKVIDRILEEDYARRNKDLDKSNEFNQMLGEVAGFAALYTYLDIGNGKLLLADFEKRAINDRYYKQADKETLTKFTSTVTER